MKKKLVTLLGVLSLLLLMGSPLTAYGSGSELNSITVIQYRVPVGVDLPARIDVLGVEQDISGTVGQSLERMAGVTFRIVRMERVNGEYRVMTGELAFSAEQTTNANGRVVFGNLPNGIYRVTQLEHELISNPEAPVIIHLPHMRDDGTFLRDVYMYPKSNVAEDGYQDNENENENGNLNENGNENGNLNENGNENGNLNENGNENGNLNENGNENGNLNENGNENGNLNENGNENGNLNENGNENGNENEGTTNNPNNPSKPDPPRLPQTAGQIGSIWFLLAVAGGVFGIGSYGFFVMKRKGI